MSNTRQSWEQQENESDRHFSWFHAFLSLGPSRTVVGAFNAFRARNSQEPPTKAKFASGAWNDAVEKWKWRERAGAYDAQQRREDEERRARRRDEDARALDERARNIAAMLYERGEQRFRFIKPYAVTSEDGKMHAEAAPPQSDMAATKMFAESVRIERQRLGLDKDPNRVDETLPERPVNDLSDDELLERLLRRLAT